MICKKCGSELKEGFVFCLECGAKIEPEQEPSIIEGMPESDMIEGASETEAPEPEEKPTRNYKKLGIIAVTAALIAALVGGLFFWFVVDVPRRYEEQLNLGSKYLEEGKYQEAVLALEKAISLDSKQPEPEVLLAEAYMGLEDTEKAVEALRNADSKIGYLQDGDKVAQLQGRMRGIAVKLIPRVEEPEEFLQKMADMSVAIRQVVTTAFPEVQLIVSYDGMAETPDKASFVVKEGGKRKPVLDVKEAGKGSVVLTYKTDIQDAVTGEERVVAIAYKNHKAEVTADSSYITPEVREALITLEQVDASAYPTIKLYYRVEDSETGDPIDGLALADFKLSELSNGALLEKNIKSFTQLEGSAGLNVEIVADISGSMDGDKISTLKEVIINFAKSLQYSHGDKIEIMAFDDEVYQICQFTTDANLVEQCVNGMSTQGTTAFYDAVIAASNQVMLQSGAKCLIVFTDGEDNASRTTIENATLYAKQYSLPLFIIGIGDGINETLLTKMAAQTGGFYKHVTQIKDLEKIYEKIYRDRKKLYMLEYETTVEIDQLQAREISLNLDSKGRCKGAASNSYTPQVAVAGESQVDVINLQTELEAQMQAQAAREANIVIDYQALAGFTTGQEYLDYLESLLSNLDGAIPNDTAKNEMVTYIEYAIGQSVKGSLTSEKNKVELTGDAVKDVYAQAEELKAQFQQMLSDYNVSLNKTIKIKAIFDVLKLDKSKAIQIYLDETLPGGMGEEDELLLLLGSSRYTFRVSTGNLLAILNSGNCTVQLTYEENGVTVAFADGKGKNKKEMADVISLGIPAESAIATVFASYGDGSDNWGGQYSSSNKNIEFSTKFAGEYMILEQEIILSDISGIERQKQQAITFMVSKGYFNVENEKFRPNDALIRYDFTEALVKMFFALDHSLSVDFSDVEKDSPYYSVVASAQKDNLVEGFPDGTFKGENTITREQVIALCARTLVEKKGYSYPENPEDYLKFTDGAGSKWARESIALAVREGLIAGDGELRAKEEITRAESADLLYSLFMLLYETPPVELSSAEQATTEGGVTADDQAVGGVSMLAIVLGALALLAVAGGAGAAVVLKKKRSKQADTGLGIEREETDEEFDYDALPNMTEPEAERMGEQGTEMVEPDREETE